MDIDKSILALLIGASLILVAGLIDDIKELSPKAKLAFQIGAALVLVWGDIRIEAITSLYKDTKLNRAWIYVNSNNSILDSRYY